VAWSALKKSLNGLINKVNTANIQNIVPELFQENLVRGRFDPPSCGMTFNSPPHHDSGLFCRSVINAQALSQTFTHVYAALVAVINTKLPQTGAAWSPPLLTKMSSIPSFVKSLTKV
jgi:pre-mRNA-splicing factor CWC22